MKRFWTRTSVAIKRAAIGILKLRKWRLHKNVVDTVYRREWPRVKRSVQATRRTANTYVSARNEKRIKKEKKDRRNKN